MRVKKEVLYKLIYPVLIILLVVLDLFSKNNVHQNVILIAKHLRKIKLSEYLEQNKSNKNKIILLDQLSDPQNIGSIIRSAFLPSATNCRATFFEKKTSLTSTPKSRDT